MSFDGRHWLTFLAFAGYVSGRAKIDVIMPPNSLNHRVMVAERQTVMLQCSHYSKLPYWWKCSSGQYSKLPNRTKVHMISSVKLSDAAYYACGGQQKSSWSQEVEVVVTALSGSDKIPVTCAASSNTEAAIISTSIAASTSTSTNTAATFLGSNPTVPQQWTSTQAKTHHVDQGHTTANATSDFDSVIPNKSTKTSLTITSKRPDLSATNRKTGSATQDGPKTVLIITITILSTVFFHCCCSVE
jgi:hypothetical protein